MDKKTLALQGAISLLEHRLDMLRIEYNTAQSDLQMIFRRYVTDKQFPIEDRFRTWSKYCIKEHSNVAIRYGDFGIIGELVDEESLDYHRNMIYDWTHFIMLITDRNEYPECYNSEYDMTIDELKEVLITENFGSFKEDF